MTHLSHPLWSDHPNNIWWSLQVMKLLIMQSSSASHYRVITNDVGDYITLLVRIAHIICNHPLFIVFPHCERASSNPYETWRKIVVLKV
jgi:hypothetical protein